MTQELSDSSIAHRDAPSRVKRNLVILAALFVVAVALVPAPRGLLELVQEEQPLGYQLQSGTKSITGSVSKILQKDLTPEQVASKAKIMIAVLFGSAFLWGTGAIPLGATDLLVGKFLVFVRHTASG